MLKEVEQLKTEIEAWKERSKAKQQLINLLKIRNEALTKTIELLTKHN